MYRVAGLLLLLNSPENSLDIHVDHFREFCSGVLIKSFKPPHTGVRKQDVDVVGFLTDLGNQPLNSIQVGNVGSNRKCPSTRHLAGQGV